MPKRREENGYGNTARRRNDQPVCSRQNMSVWRTFGLGRNVQVLCYNRYGYEEQSTYSSADFARRCVKWFKRRGITIECIQTDNGFEFTNRFSSNETGRKSLFERTLAEMGIRHKLIRPYTPRHNGKVERRYINSGVLLMNLKRLREDGMTSRMKELGRSKFFPYLDQDIINYSCGGNVRFLNKRFNVFHDDTVSDLKYLRDHIAGTDEIFRDEALIHPAIIHYIGPRKPWKDHTVKYAEIWLQASSQS